MTYTAIKAMAALMAWKARRALAHGKCLEIVVAGIIEPFPTWLGLGRRGTLMTAVSSRGAQGGSGACGGVREISRDLAPGGGRLRVIRVGGPGRRPL